jgi:sec-independent protein translocase protein TatC
MLLTPPDIISQTLIAVPMWLLFEAGLIFAPMFKRSAPISDGKDTEAESASTANKYQAVSVTCLKQRHQ